MRVISNKALKTFSAIHPDADAPVQARQKIIEAKSFFTHNEYDKWKPWGSQSTVAEILEGTEELNIRQVKALAARFQMPATLFL